MDGYMTTRCACGKATDHKSGKCHLCRRSKCMTCGVLFMSTKPGAKYCSKCRKHKVKGA